MPKEMWEVLGLGSPNELNVKREVPGTIPVKGREFWYVEDDGNNDFNDLFHKAVGAIQPPIPRSGGATTEGCTLTLPDGRKFHAMSYKGDLEGWRKQIRQGAAQLKLVAAQLIDGDLIISKNERISLSECEVRFY